MYREQSHRKRFKRLLAFVGNFVKNFVQFFTRRVNASDRIDKNRRIMEMGRPFEPRSGSTLVEPSSLFCGHIQKGSDAFTRMLLDISFQIQLSYLSRAPDKLAYFPAAR